MINKDGQDYAVVKADLVRATSRRMTVRVKRPDGSHSDPIGINISAERAGQRRMARRRPIQDVAVGQELTAYISVKDPGIALAPADEAAPVEFTPVPATPEPEPAAGGGCAPRCRRPRRGCRSLGTIGFVLLALGAGIAFLRRRSPA